MSEKIRFFAPNESSIASFQFKDELPFPLNISYFMRVLSGHNTTSIG